MNTSPGPSHLDHRMHTADLLVIEANVRSSADDRILIISWLSVSVLSNASPS